MVTSRHLPPALLLALAASLGGCGTMVTRGDLHAPVGAYPLEAIGFDLSGLYHGFTEPTLWHPEHDRAAKVAKEGEVIGLILSLPADLVFDVVLLPVDLVAWVFGARKNGGK